MPDGQWLVYGSKRDGVRKLYVMHLSDRKEWRITDLAKGRAAILPGKDERPSAFPAEEGGGKEHLYLVFRRAK